MHLKCTRITHLIFLLISAPASYKAGDVLVCNGGSTIGRAFTASIYAKYPVRHTDECDNPSKYEAFYSLEITACQVLIMWGPYTVSACVGTVTKLRFDRLARCENLARRLADQSDNLNAQIPESDAPFDSESASGKSAEIYSDFSVGIHPNALGTNFGARNLHTVTW